MSREKYLANIDRVLEDVIRRNSENVGDKNKIVYSEEMEEDGSILKIAFDVFRVSDDPYNSLWTVDEIQGTKYLIRSNDPQYKDEHRGSWTATSNYDKNDVTLAYNKIPIARFPANKYGFSPSEIITFKMALLDSVNDESFIRDVLFEQPASKREALASQFPEFQKIIKG